MITEYKIRSAKHISRIILLLLGAIMPWGKRSHRPLAGFCSPWRRRWRKRWGRRRRQWRMAFCPTEWRSWRRTEQKTLHALGSASWHLRMREGGKNGIKGRRNLVRKDKKQTAGFAARTKVTWRQKECVCNGRLQYQVEATADLVAGHLAEEEEEA